MKKRHVFRLIPATVATIALAAVLSQTGSHAQSIDTLTYSRGFLVTGNYVVGGVDLPRAGGVGTINFNAARGNQIPANAEVIAAYLFWETLEANENPLRFEGAQFRGTPIDLAKATRTTAVPTPSFTCWGEPGGSNITVTIYRADVLALLPKQYDVNDKWTGRYLLNDADLTANSLPLHTVTLPSQGLVGARATLNAGASLAVVYRKPDEPLRKIVIYDGLQSQSAVNTTHTIRGFYRAAAGASARMLYIAASGADNFNESLTFNNQPVATNIFPSPAQGAIDRAWSNRTFEVGSKMGAVTPNSTYGDTAVARVSHAGARDCVNFAALIFSTAVADDDRDGLPDGLEAAESGLFDPPTPQDSTGPRLPNLYAMGARVGQRDLLVEINAFKAPANTTYGAAEAPYNATTVSVTDPLGHDHMPPPAVLKRVGDTYLGGGIAAHFDVGNVEAYRALYPCPVDDVSCDASAYLVPSAHARGGERIQERACENCQFEHFPGTVGWPYGLQLYRDAPVNIDGGELATLEDIQQGLPEDGNLRRRFDRVRHDYFHYALYAHARGKAKSPFPCVDGGGIPVDYSDVATRSCAVGPNPQFKVPLSSSGAAALPGNTVLVTLGLWDTVKFVGSEFIQASTTLHELGHNGDLWHGGGPAALGNKALGTPTTVDANCNPTYRSSMSYLFQAHGLYDNSGAIHIDYSGSATDPINESGLSDSPLFPLSAYRSAWFAPADSPLALTQEVPAAKRYCTGIKFDVPPVPAMARVLAAASDAAIDWDGQPSTPAASADVNFDGLTNTALKGYNDWANFRLDQIRATRTARIFRIGSLDLLDFGSGDLLDFGSGDLLDFGSGDLLDFGSGTHIVHLGSGDFFRYGSGDLLDFGSGDLLDFGSGDLIDFGSGVLMFVGADGDLLDFGSGDLLDFGSGDLLDFGSGDLLDFGSGDLLDFGSGDLLDFGSGDLLDFGSGTGLEELDFDAAIEISVPRISDLTACVLGADCPGTPLAGGDPDYHRIKLTWTAPPFKPVSTYDVYRATGTGAPILIVTTPNDTFTDPEELPHGVEFRYTVQATFTDATQSPVSDEVKKTAINDAPVAVNDSGSYTTNQGVALSIAAPGVLSNDVDTDSTFRRVASIPNPPGNGTLALNANGSFLYTPSPAFFGTDTFTYLADNGAWSRDASVPLSGLSNAATVTITVVRRPNVPPACNNLSATVITGGSVTLNASCTDADGNPLTVTAVSGATLGTVVLNPDKSFKYTATSPKVGADSFTYTVSDGFTTTTATVNVSVIYGFLNVQNAPPSPSSKFNSGSTVPVRWKWTNKSGTALNTAAAGARVEAYACSTSGSLPGAYPTGTFTPELPGSGNSFGFSASSNTWSFNWKLVYTSGGRVFNLPAGTYVLQIKSTVTGQTDPGTVHNCAGGTTVRGALVQVK